MKKLSLIWIIVILLVVTSHIMADKERMTNEKQSAYEAIKEFTDLSEQNLQMIGQLSSNSGVFDIYNTENSFVMKIWEVRFPDFLF